MLRVWKAGWRHRRERARPAPASTGRMYSALRAWRDHLESGYLTFESEWWVSVHVSLSVSGLFSR